MTSFPSPTVAFPRAISSFVSRNLCGTEKCSFGTTTALDEGKEEPIQQQNSDSLQPLPRRLDSSSSRGARIARALKVFFLNRRQRRKPAHVRSAFNKKGARRRSEWQGESRAAKLRKQKEWFPRLAPMFFLVLRGRPPLVRSLQRAVNSLSHLADWQQVSWLCCGGVSGAGERRETGEVRKRGRCWTRATVKES